MSSNFNTNRYKAYGDTHPPRQVLDYILGFARMKGATRKDPELWLTAAHACIDLSVYSGLTAKNISSLTAQATSYFEKITDLADQMKRTGNATAYKQISSWAVAATLQKSELPRWYSTARGNPPKKTMKSY